MHNYGLCFYDPDKGRALDSFNPNTCRGLWGERTLAQHQREDGPRVRVETDAVAARLMEAWDCTPVESITRERFEELRDVLPPQGYHHTSHVESFYMSEFQRGRVTLHLLRLGEHCFQWHAAVQRTHAQRFSHYLAAMAEACALEAV